MMIGIPSPLFVSGWFHKSSQDKGQRYLHQRGWYSCLFRIHSHGSGYRVLAGERRISKSSVGLSSLSSKMKDRDISIKEDDIHVYSSHERGYCVLAGERRIMIGEAKLGEKRNTHLTTSHGWDLITLSTSSYDVCVTYLLSFVNPLTYKASSVHRVCILSFFPSFSTSFASWLLILLP